MNANMHLKQKHERMTMKAKAKARADALKEDVDADASGLRRSSRKRKPVERDEVDESPDPSEEGFHFIAFMPIGSQVWSMDGMDSYPRNIGSVSPNGEWLDVARSTNDPFIDASESSDNIDNAKIPRDTNSDIVGSTKLRPQGSKSIGLNDTQKEVESRRQDIIKAKLRRHDYREFFTAWVDALKDADVLEPLAAHVRAED